MTGSGLSINNYPLPYQLLKPAEQSPANGKLRQETAASGAQLTIPQQQPTQKPQEETSVQQQAFLTQLMEQMLANRIGLDKQKFDEITEKIKETEAEKDDLLQKPQSASRDKQIAALDAKLEQLSNALDGLVAQANRNREQKERAEQAAKDIEQQYRTAAYGAKEPKLFL